MTKGTTEETADGMAMDKIKAIIEDLRHERYRWSPARRVYIPKKNGTKRPLGVQSWSDKLVQAGSEAFFAMMHLESDAVVHASCLSTTKPLLRCLQPPSVWECDDFIQV